MIAGTTCEPVVRGEAGVDPGEVVADPGPAVVADAEVAGGPRNVIPPLLLVAVVGSTAVDDAVFAPSPQPARVRAITRQPATVAVAEGRKFLIAEG